MHKYLSSNLGSNYNYDKRNKFSDRFEIHEAIFMLADGPKLWIVIVCQIVR